MKSKVTAYLLWFFLGGIGAHKFYLNKPGMGILYILTFGLLGIGWLVDLFTLGRQVDQYNQTPPAERPSWTPPPSAVSRRSDVVPPGGKKAVSKSPPKKTIETSRQELGIPPGKVFHILYEDSNGSVTERDIEIVKTSQRGEKLYIHAFCHLRLAVRLFSVDRIISITDNGQKIDVYEYLSRDFTPLSGEDMAALALEDD